MRVEKVCMNGADSMLTYEQLINYVNQGPDPDILPAELYWMYYDAASKKGQLDQFWQCSCLKVQTAHLHQPMLPRLVVICHHSNTDDREGLTYCTGQSHQEQGRCH